jgi:glycosyltransferase involved in cell wall biosynthesis
VIAGEGPQRRALELQIVAAGLTSAVSLLGERSDVRQIMAASDAYVNMTDEEGFGIAVVEAMQASIPVVLADAGALPELICDGQDGILVRSGDANALFRALSTLMADPAYARRLGQSARRRALERFSIERYLAGLEGVLTSVAAGRSTRGPSGGDAQSMRARGDAS